MMIVDLEQHRLSARTNKTCLAESTFDSNFINVIRDSAQSTMGRLSLLADRRRILDLDPHRDAKQWCKLEN